MSLAPSQNLFLAGHQGAAALIESAWTSGRMPHAWLISGPEGIGKATFAYHVAHFVFSNGQSKIGALDPNDKITRLISASSHPDLFVLERPVDEKTGATKNTIPVENAREIPLFFHQTSGYGGWRVAIIDGAQALNRHGQNAILKIIEEPPSKTIILITTTTPGALLPTIKSRCRSLALSPLSDQEMTSVLTKIDMEKSDVPMEDIVALAEGSVGFALELAETDAYALFKETMALVNAPKVDMPKLHQLADKIGRKTSSGDPFPIFRRLLTTNLNQNVKKAALAKTDQDSMRISLGVLEEVIHTLDIVDTSNLDRKTAFLNAFSKVIGAN